VIDEGVEVWGGNAAITAANTSTGAFPLTDPNSADSAILLTLNPGSYSVHMIVAS